MRRSLLLLTLCFMVGNGCDGGGRKTSEDSAASLQASNSSSIFSDSIAEFHVHVYYEDGAVPYTGKIGLTTKDIWDITKTSYQTLFQNHVGRSVYVPTVLGQMIALSDQARTTWDAASLHNLAESYAVPLMSGDQVHVSLFFVNGTYQGDDTILGIQFTGDNYAFVFKDVVVQTGGDAVSQRYVEQATVVHELGHVVGLVNNGVPMVVAHEDSTHPKHAADSGDVMYWAIESRKQALSSLLGAISGSRMQLFGADTLTDGQSFHP